MGHGHQEKILPNLKKKNSKWTKNHKKKKNLAASATVQSLQKISILNSIFLYYCVTDENFLLVVKAVCTSTL